MELTSTQKKVVIILTSTVAVIAVIATFIPDARQYAVEISKAFLGSIASMVK